MRSKWAAGVISHNVAREFPLETPNTKSNYLVERTSVRNLLGTINLSDGAALLWCSVRRSGKTTACLGLARGTADPVVVLQTCGTGPTPDARRFYNRVCDAVASESPLGRDFVEAAVEECAPVSDEGRRKVFVVDEYESLFRLLRSAAERDSYLRYTVVQPLLNQMAEFARENLLILLGQQPEAHFILMDQNQLAPYVRQNPFPLFQHVEGSRASEFGELVGKILTEKIGCDSGFVGSLHRETAGHPYLTVNVLRALVDWLIEQKRPSRGLTLGRTNPWLFTTYWLLHDIGRAGADDLSMPRGQLAGLLNGIPAPGPLPDANQILRGASLANFLWYDDHRVGVKIRTLGRLAAAIWP